MGHSRKLGAKQTVAMGMAFSPGAVLKLGWVHELEPGTKEKISMTVMSWKKQDRTTTGIK